MNRNAIISVRQWDYLNRHEIDCATITCIHEQTLQIKNRTEPDKVSATVSMWRCKDGKIWQSERALRPVDQVRHAGDDVRDVRELAVADDAGDEGADAGELLQEEHEGLQRRGINRCDYQSR